MKKNNRETGAKAEAIACWFLKQQGYDVLEQNFYTKVGEIDIIAKEDQTLVFVEVKYRKDDKKGYPAQAVDQRKQQKIRKSAMIYLKIDDSSLNKSLHSFESFAVFFDLQPVPDILFYHLFCISLPQKPMFDLLLL